MTMDGHASALDKDAAGVAGLHTWQHSQESWKVATSSGLAAGIVKMQRQLMYQSEMLN
jgi:hypothetical protein